MTALSPDLRALAASIEPVEQSVLDLATQYHLSLTKPPGSLGRLEDVGVRLAAMAGTAIPPRPGPVAVAIFAGDHGVLAEGVSPWPQEVTAQMVGNFLAGGAAINAIAARIDAQLLVVNAGVAAALEDAPGLLNTPIAHGTENLRLRSAMTLDHANRAVELGVTVAADAVANGARCLITGDMGIGNTTPSAALIAAFTGKDPAEVTGRGTGVDDATLERKIEVIADGLARIGDDRSDPIGVLAEVGGLEIAGLVGLCLGGAAKRVPVLVDGVIAAAAAVVAHAIAPAAVDYLVAGHRSVEPGASAALAHLGLEPLVDLELRLGEGTGAALAYPLLDAAAAIMNDMATFDSAGVTDKTEGADQ